MKLSYTFPFAGQIGNQIYTEKKTFQMPYAYGKSNPNPTNKLKIDV